MDQSDMLREYRTFMLRAYQLNNAADPLIQSEIISKYYAAVSENERDCWLLRIKSKVEDALIRMINLRNSELHRKKLQELQAAVTKTKSFKVILSVITQANFIFSIWSDVKGVNF